jgi:hypothetical protein
MSIVNNPSTLPEIKAAFERVHAEVAGYFGNIPVGRFFEHPPEVWSAGENLQHLTKSVKPVAQAMRLPKLVPQMLFGEARAESRGFTELVETYKGALGAGGVSPTSFVPELGAVEDEAFAKADLLAKWNRMTERLMDALATWSEEDLDRYQLPHPLIGKLTVRELLFFTLYHDLHHVNDVRRLLGQPEVEI